MPAKKLAKRPKAKSAAKRAAASGRTIAPPSAKVAVSSKVAASMLQYAGEPHVKLVLVKPARKGAPARGKTVGELVVDERSGSVKIEPPITVTPTEIANDAFAPSAKALALLEGVKRAEADLKKAGGAFPLEDVLTLLRVTRQAVHNKVQEGALFSIKGPGGRVLFPTLQFTDDGPIAGLKDVIAAFPSTNRYMLLNFLVHPDDRLDDRAPIELLKQGKVDLVVQAARGVGEQGA